MLDFVLSFSVSETNNYVLMENVVKEDGFSKSNNYNLIRCTKILFQILQGSTAHAF